MPKQLILLSLILLSATTNARSQKISLIHADRSEFEMSKKGTIGRFEGNVHFTRVNADLYADKAIWYEGQRRISLSGDVRLIEPERMLSADRIHYNSTEKIANLIGNVLILDSGRDVRIDGGKGIYRQDEEFLVMTEKARLILDVSRGVVQTFITADTIEFFSLSNQIVGLGNVRITQGSLQAESDSALFLVDQERFRLNGNVFARQRENSLTGNQMTVISQNKIVEKISVTGDGESAFRQPAKADTIVYNESRLTANRLDFFFVNDRLELIKAEGNSFSYYTPAPKDTVAKGRNVVSGDSIIVNFENSELHQVDVITSAEGVYITPFSFDSAGTVIKEDTVNYQASRICFRFREDLIQLSQAAKVVQGSVNLDAVTIDYDLNERTIFAHGAFDSSHNEFIPVRMRDHNEDITGDEMVYNLDSKRGKIRNSKTKLENAYYSGGILRKEEENQLLVRGGMYTTCENDEPHFHFSSQNMKLISGDKVLARPVVLYIETLPVLALPYFIFSTQKGRHSGFLPFQIGNLDRGRRFINNIGYYWALSDYWDLKTYLDVSEDRGITFNTRANYHLRYNFSGWIFGSFLRESQFRNYKRFPRTRWQFSFAHSHTIDPSLRIVGDGTFVSDASYYTDFSTDLQQRLNRQLRSKLSISKRWENAWLTAAVDQTKDLDKNSHSESYPTVSFSRPSKPLFGTPLDKTKKRWYNDIYYSYNSNLSNFGSKSMIGDTLATRKRFLLLRQDMNVRAPQKIMNAITFSPALKIQDAWFYLPYSDQADSAGLEANTLKSRQLWSSSLAASTNLYGRFEPNLFGITAFRHVLSPSISFNYQPKITRNSEYASFAGAGGSSSERKSVSVSLGNLFQLKYKKGKKDRKLDLFKATIRASHDFLRDERRWSDISTSVQTRGIRNPSINFNFTHDPYDEKTGNLKWWSPRLKSFSISTRYAGGITLYPGQKFDPATWQITGEKQPSSLLRYSLSHRYSENRNSNRTFISHWLSFDIRFSPARNWQVKYSQNYDIRRKQTTEKVIALERDLHCWQGSFTWIPTGSRKGYYFKLNVKLLPQLKFEKSQSDIQGILEGAFRGAIQ